MITKDDVVKDARFMATGRLELKVLKRILPTEEFPDRDKVCYQVANTNFEIEVHIDEFLKFVTTKL